jgi:hypothetical protein
MNDAKPNGKHDVITHRFVVSCLGACVLHPSAVPPALPALGGTALGSLTGMLAAVMRQS